MADTESPATLVDDLAAQNPSQRALVLTFPLGGYHDGTVRVRRVCHIGAAIRVFVLDAMKLRFSHRGGG